ncbi:hypothetical protein A2U01_0095943, partial [Trifolium medium]|nr:hypothetical protein [Trifolium medium]
MWVQFWNPTLRLRSEISQTLPVTNFPMHLGSGYDDSSDTYK